MSASESFGSLFEAVFDTAPDAVLVIGSDGTILAANSAFAGDYGFGKGEVVGKSLLSLGLVQTASQAPLQRYLAALGGEFGPAPDGIDLLTSRGDRRRAALAGVSFQHGGRGVSALLLRGVAVSPQRGMRDREKEGGEQRYRSLFDHSPIPLWEEDISAVKLWIEEKRQSGVADFAAYFASHHEDVVRCARLVRVTDVNQASATMYAAGNKEELISGMSRVFSKETYDTFMDELLAIAAGKTVGESETIHHTLAGKLKYVLRRWSVAPGYEDTLSKVLVAIVDITDHKRIERRLEAYARTLENAYKKLQKLDKMKDDFLSTVSHELRTPLTSIKGFAEILLNYEEDADTRKEFLTIINNEAERLTRLVNDVLDLSRIEAGRMQWDTSKLSMGQIVQAATASAHGVASQRRVNLVASVEEGLPPVWGDRDRFVQVITNLLSNAVKFSREGGEVRVKAELPRPEAGAPASAVVRVSVSDDGIGIAPDDQARIFDRFVQVGDTLTDKPIGTGLGLSICKEILGHYRGRIWVESELGKGSTFSFVVPVAEATEPDKEGSQPEGGVQREDPPRQAGGRTILVVDDEASIRRYLNHELTSRGYQVIEAADGQAAIDTARTLRPDLVTLDIRMPQVDGFDVAAALRNDPQTKAIPILIVSIVDDKERGQKVGAGDYLTKPIDIEQLAASISKLLTGQEPGPGVV